MRQMKNGRLVAPFHAELNEKMQPQSGRFFSRFYLLVVVLEAEMSDQVFAF